MTPDEVNERAWQQMRAMTDEEIENHDVAKDARIDYSGFELDIWDYRIAVRDYFFNELWREVKPLRKDA